MRQSLFALALLPFFVLCQENHDYWMNSELKVNSIGFAPIPAFSFDLPIFHPRMDINLKRLNLSSDLAIGLNGKPWLLNLKAKYTVVDNGTYSLTLGANPFLFFYEDVNSLSETFIAAQRNLSLEVGSEIKLANKTDIRLVYLNNNGLDTGALSGHYFALAPFFGPLYRNKNLSILFNPDINYLNFDGGIQGSFFNAFLIVDFIKLPLKIQLQMVKRLWADFDVFNFSWNAGITWNFIKITKKTKAQQ